MNEWLEKKHLTEGIHQTKLLSGGSLFFIGSMMLYQLVIRHLDFGTFVYRFIPGWLLYLSSLIALVAGLALVALSFRSTKCSYCHIPVSVTNLYYHSSHEFQVQKAISMMNVDLVKYLPVSDLKADSDHIQLELHYCSDCERVAKINLRKETDCESLPLVSGWVLKDDKVREFIQYAKEVEI